MENDVLGYACGLGYLQEAKKPAKGPQSASGQNFELPELYGRELIVPCYVSKLFGFVNNELMTRDRSLSRFPRSSLSDSR